MSDTAVGRNDLRDVARSILDDLAGPAAVRALLDDTDGYDPKLWAAFTTAGWPGIEIPEEFDGAGGAFGDLATGLIEMGRHLVAGPLFATTVLASGALMLGGTHRQRRIWLPRFADSTALATAALDGVEATPESGASGLRARPDGDGWIIDGTASYVPDAHLADVIVLQAQGPQGDILILAEPTESALAVTQTPMLDQTRRLCEVAADGLRLGADAVMATGDRAASVAAAVADRAALALACDSLAMAERVLEMTTLYAGQRRQFDRPIGSFQAVKHRCADMLIAVETARLIVNDALRVADDGVPGAHLAIAVSRAKSYACDAAAQLASDGTDIHGGIGFTWEHDMHLYLKRAKLNQTLYGNSRWHRRRIADLTLP